MRMRNQQQRFVQLIIIGSAIVLGIGLLIAIIPSHSGINVVKAFYKHEQKQEFWNAYELFHPYMKERFTRDRYIDQRSHIFVNHFGVESFDLEFGKSSKINNWKMSANHEPLDQVYKIPVTKTYKSAFGRFSIKQNVFTVKEDGDWYVLWDYDY
ncbi:hypothetical protein [Halalkalibacter alkalisediminis]|uniref:DUF4348 domain-containing protein n=1 Tax=Halalkalibacter alkalisediminis TaxID=935616 RepID=A0ABV6NEN5_9BACI|nr:hypothetical protein [Halalkalibacter alkalisediminis]